jgi:methyl-accepting chemotaxis protein
MAPAGKSRQPELRKKPRRAFHYRACIVTADKKALLCSIADISETGARIILTQDCELPDQFVLLLSRGGQARRKCRLVWRDGLAIGVAFPEPA